MKNPFKLNFVQAIALKTVLINHIRLPFWHYLPIERYICICSMTHILVYMLCVLVFIITFSYSFTGDIMQV